METALVTGSCAYVMIWMYVHMSVTDSPASACVTHHHSFPLFCWSTKSTFTGEFHLFSFPFALFSFLTLQRPGCPNLDENENEIENENEKEHKIKHGQISHVPNAF